MSDAAAATSAGTRAVIADLLSAIHSRDLRNVARVLHPDVSWRNVPHPPTVGRDAVVALLGGVLTWSDQVQWDVVSDGYEPGRAWLERVDRFQIDGDWLDVRCNGVIITDAAGLVREVRDYVDLGEWRDRVGPVFDRLAARPAAEVVQRHLDAVTEGTVVAMAADYAIDAVLVRGDESYEGWGAIADYFDNVPDRLGGRIVTFDDVTATSSGGAQTRWSIAGDDVAQAANGVDTFIVEDGRIVHQTVELLSDDF